MNILIASDSEIMTHLVRLLYDENHNISIFCPEEYFDIISNTYDVMTYSGDPTSIDDLKNAEVHKMDLVIILYKDTRTSLLSSIICKNLGARRCIAKVNDAQYSVGESRQLFKSLGVDYVVCPEKIAAKEITNLINLTAAAEVFDFSDKQLSMVMLKVEKKAKVLGKSLAQVALENKEQVFRTVAIQRGNHTIIPKGTDVFMENDLAYVVTRPDGIDYLIDLAAKEPFSIKNIMIIGGGTIGELTAKSLENDYTIKLVEKDRARADELAEMLTKTMIINGDAHDIALLDQESIRNMDAIVAVTNSSETNIFTCLIAKNMGVKKTIALVENLDYIEISQNIGIDTIINKKLVTASYIIRFTLKSEVVSTKCLNGIDAEVFEFLVTAGSPITKKPINKLKFPDTAIIGGVIRGNEGLMATGDLQIQSGDKVIVFTLSSAFDTVDRMFRN